MRLVWRRHMRRAAILAVTLTALALAGPAPASARPGKPKDQIVITGSVTVPRDRVVDTIVIADGTVTVSGRVDGDLVTVTKRAHLLAGARVRHDLIYGDKKPVVDARATVGGKVRHQGYNKAGTAFGWALGILLWLGVTVSSVILGLLLVALAPRAVHAAWEAADS